MTATSPCAQPLPHTTLRGGNGFGDSILFSGHTLAGSPPGNLRTTVRARDALR